jgi:hypothetical protein
LRREVRLRPLSAGRVFVDGPNTNSVVLDERAGQVLALCQGQPIAELLPEAQRALEYECTAEELAGFLDSLKKYGIFEGIPRKLNYVRLFNPGPLADFLVKHCPWAFSAVMVAGLFALLGVGLVQLVLYWDVFVAQVQSATAEHPWLSMLLYYAMFIPVGLLHELGHGAACRWFGGELLEVGFLLSGANPVVKSNKAALSSDRAKIVYFAGGVLVDMFVFFALVNIWLAWPNYWTTLLLLPQAIFVLQFSYTVEAEQDLPRIIAQWSKAPEAPSRIGFLRELFRNPPKTGMEKRRAAVYLSSIILQAAVFVLLVWTFRQPVTVHLLPGFAPTIPFWPVVLYWTYRGLRKLIFNLPEWSRRWRMRPAAQTS